LVLMLLVICVPCTAYAEMRELDLSMRPKTAGSKRIKLDLNPPWPAHDRELVRVPKPEESRKINTHGKFPALLGAAPTAYWHQVVIHEGMHALAAAAMGRDVRGFYPYPHMHDSEFYFGRVSVDKEGLSDGQRILFSLAPAISDAVVFGVCDALLSAETPHAGSTAGAIVFMLGIVAPAVDFMANFWGGSDWEKARKAAGGKAWMLNATGAVTMAVMVWRTLTHARSVFRKSL